MLHYRQNLEKAVREKIRNIPDFPKEGIQFKDITPLFKDIELFNKYIDYSSTILKRKDITKIVCVDARGFIFGTALALRMGIPFVLARKSGKLPSKTIGHTYSLEYGEATVEMHVDDIKVSDSVLVVDDLLATGGTVNAVVDLVEKLGAKVHGCFFLIELAFLEGKEKIKSNNENLKFYSLIEY